MIPKNGERRIKFGGKQNKRKKNVPYSCTMILHGGDVCPIRGEYKIVDYDGKTYGNAFADAGDTMPVLPEKLQYEYYG